MKCPLSSNLVSLIEQAIDNCFYDGEGHADNKKGIAVFAEWVEHPEREDYSLIHLTITENGSVKFVYDDYGTECKN